MRFLRLLFFGALFLARYALPCSGIVPRFSAVLLLYYYRTHMVGSWVVGCFFSAACCAVLLLYGVLLLYCCCTGWLGGPVRGCVHGFVGGLVLFLVAPLYQPRAVMVQRTTSLTYYTRGDLPEMNRTSVAVVGG